jgi:cell division protein FtsB
MRAADRARPRPGRPSGRRVSGAHAGSEPKPPLTRAERRRAAEKRRNRFLLVVSAVVSIVIAVAWFPASDLLHQRQQLAAASTQLQKLDQQNQTLEKEAKGLKTPAEIEKIAEQQYDLVEPGQQAYQVLPASGSGNGVGLGTSGGTARHSTAGKKSSSSASTPASSGDFFSRVLDTLEFWR